MADEAGCWLNFWMRGAGAKTQTFGVIQQAQIPVSG